MYMTLSILQIFLLVYTLCVVRTFSQFFTNEIWSVGLSSILRRVLNVRYIHLKLYTYCVLLYITKVLPMGNMQLPETLHQLRK